MTSRPYKPRSAKPGKRPPNAGSPKPTSVSKAAVKRPAKNDALKLDMKPNKSVRLNKAIADSGICSRRKADELIAQGKVSVNGKRVTTLGQSVRPESDKILLNGKPLPILKPLYIAFHKPRGYITTRKDELDRQTIYALLPEKWHSADPAGRLDKESSGLLILSNDGEFLNRITHPRYQCYKRYRVCTQKPLSEAAAAKLLAGVTLQPENKTAKIENLSALPVDSANPKEWPYELTLQTGYNRQIRRSFEAVGFVVVKLKRVAFGAIKLGQLKPGDARPLRPFEIQQLLKPSEKTIAKGKPKSQDKRSSDALKTATQTAKKPRTKTPASETAGSTTRSAQALPKPKR